MSLIKKSLKEAKEYVQKTLSAGLVPYVCGEPGVGKSTMIKSIADQHNLKFIDIRLSQEDPTALQGFPKIIEGRSTYQPPSIYPLEQDPIPEGYKGWLILFDELPSAPRSTLAAAYKILLDRMIGEHKLHSKCLMVCAGNRAEDEAIVFELGTALRSRLVHIHVTTDHKDYLDYCIRNNYDSRLICYLDFKKENINLFADYGNINDETFACERTWSFVNKLLAKISPNQFEPIPDKYSDLICGTVGSIGHEFISFTQAFNDLPKFEDILKEQAKVAIPSKPAFRYLLISMLVNKITDSSHIEPVSDYIKRMNQEYQFIFVKILWSKHPELVKHPSISNIFDKIADALFN